MLAAGATLTTAGLSLLIVTLASASHKAVARGHWGLGMLAHHERSRDSAQASVGDGPVVILNESEAQTSFLDLGASGGSAGDEIIIHGPLYDGAQAHVVGQVDVVCTLSFNGSLCDATALFPGRGELRFGGPASSDAFLFAIDGGTGSFKSADGQVRVESGVPSTDLDRLTLQISND